MADTRPTPWWIVGRQRKQWYTLTLGDVAENGPTMEKIGKLADKGMSVESLRQLHDRFLDQKVPCKLVDLAILLEGYTKETVPEAALLVVGLNEMMEDSNAEDALVEEVSKMPTDKTHLDDYGRGVVHSKSRYNNTIDDRDQAPDIAKGKGTVVNFKDYPMADKLRRLVTALLDTTKLCGELNHYFDPAKCGISWHGDKERRCVVGVRLGKGSDGVPLMLQWYKRGAAIGPEVRIPLTSGNVYFMSEKAVGFDCENSTILTLRHAAGRDSFHFSRDKCKAEAQPVVYLSALPK